MVTGNVRGGSVFRGQTRLQIGGKWHELLGRVERPYRGVMAGLVYNKLRYGMVWYDMVWYGPTGGSWPGSSTTNSGDRRSMD